MPENPGGGSRETSDDPRQPAIRIPCRVLKGGLAPLCAHHGRRYRLAARHAGPAATSASHVEFRSIERQGA
jgi:hypothetical protein